MSGGRNILLLGGTRDARALATRLTAMGHRVTTSLAGRTLNPHVSDGAMRIGGFGGAAGLAAELRTHGYDYLIDATHPFAETISANAVEAAKRTGIPLLRLERPAWQPVAGDRWQEVASPKEAAAHLSEGARALVTIGRQEIAPFLLRTDIFCLLRMIEQPSLQLPPHAELLLARPPFSLNSERALLRERRISVLVTKNAGGTSTYAKLEAARNLCLPVLLIARPALASAETVSSIDELVMRL